MNEPEKAEPTGLEWATVDEISNELSRRFDSFVLTYSSDHETDSAFFKPNVIFKDTLASIGLLRLATVIVESSTINSLRAPDDSGDSDD